MGPRTFLLLLCLHQVGQCLDGAGFFLLSPGLCGFGLLLGTVDPNRGYRQDDDDGSRQGQDRNAEELEATLGNVAPVLGALDVSG